MKLPAEITECYKNFSLHAGLWRGKFPAVYTRVDFHEYSLDHRQNFVEYIDSRQFSDIRSQKLPPVIVWQKTLKFTIIAVLDSVYLSNNKTPAKHWNIFCQKFQVPARVLTHNLLSARRTPRWL